MCSYCVQHMCVSCVHTVFSTCVYHVQGILGTDNRHYALDLFRIFPPDPNYTKLEDEGEKEGEGKGEKEGGYRHKLAVLRPELLETFLQ